MSFDPAMSEWGNPITLIGDYFAMNQIVTKSYTWGSETSQYPQEKKSIDIA